MARPPTPDPATVRLTTLVTPSEHETIKYEAALQKHSVSKFIRIWTMNRCKAFAKQRKERI